MMSLTLVQTMHRPWLEMYSPQEGCLLAQRISEASHSGGGGGVEDDDGFPLASHMELWVKIAAAAKDFRTICSLAAVCHGLQELGRDPQLWEQLCRSAFAMRGFRPCDEVLREYSWSWREMFRRRKRLRFDGFYYLASTKLLHGLNEGRGMKESNKDFYNTGGRWVTSYRLLRFFPDGSMFSHLFASSSPVTLRKPAKAVDSANPATLARNLRGACWGTYSLRELKEARDDSRGCAAPSPVTHMAARVLLYDEEYPHMMPSTVGYRFELRSRTDASAGAASNSELHLVEHNLYGEDDSGEPAVRFPLPVTKLVFMPFAGPLPPAAPLRPLAPRASGQ